MAQTPLSTNTPYASVSDLFDWHDSDQVADLIRLGSNTRPTLVEMLTSTPTPTAAYTLIHRYLMAGSGRIESVCLIGNRYRPTDLQALTGASREMLVKLSADLSFWMLCQRRQPNSADPKNVPGALEALEMLKILRDGEAIFGFVESGNAGLPSVVQANPSILFTPNVVDVARRIFPRAQINRLNGGGS